MSILLLGTFLDTVAAFELHIMYTLGNTSQINQHRLYDLLRLLREKQVADRGGFEPPTP
jgi:hypothetical protein